MKVKFLAGSKCFKGTSEIEDFQKNKIYPGMIQNDSGIVWEMFQDVELVQSYSFIWYSGSVSGGNQVDGLLCALHIEAGRVPHGGFGQRLSMK